LLLHQRSFQSNFLSIRGQVRLDGQNVKPAKKQESGRQARRAAMRQAQHIQAYVSIGESRATLNGSLRRSFSTAC
jgi:hypothetical protein